MHNCFVNDKPALHPDRHSFPTRRSSDLVQKNLAEPLAEIRRTLEALCLPDVEIRTLVRTGDTPAPARQEMVRRRRRVARDRKSTRLNSSHITTSYAVFCLKKKTRTSSR